MGMVGVALPRGVGGRPSWAATGNVT
jgi:hypothetical protein